MLFVAINLNEPQLPRPFGQNIPKIFPTDTFGGESRALENVLQITQAARHVQWLLAYQIGQEPCLTSI